jgi:hypothetical protein
MKKLTLTVATLLSGVSVFAQNNTSVVNQSGDHNKGNVLQTGKHASTILQTSNAASASQENSADVTQSDISQFQLRESNSRVEQFGNSHVATVVQDGNNNLEAYIGAAGAFNQNNETYAKQYGSVNSGLQRIEGTASSGSFLSLNQTGGSNESEQIAFQAADSKGWVAQSGEQNRAIQRIEGNDNEAKIQQTSDGNDAFQQIVGLASSGNYSSIVQSGNDNNARIVTEGSDNKFEATQVKDRNSVVGLDGSATSNATQTGDGNDILLNQIGYDNAFRIRQVGDNNSVGGAGVLGALQLGDNNTAIFSQEGFDLKIISDQYGNNNFHEVNQTGNGSESITRQSGSSNRANVTQANQ